MPEHVKKMGIFLGRSQMTKSGLGAQAVGLLKRIGFSQISWKPGPEHPDEEDEASGYDPTAFFSYETPEPVEELVGFFKDLNLAG